MYKPSINAALTAIFVIGVLIGSVLTVWVLDTNGLMGPDQTRIEEKLPKIESSKMTDTCLELLDVVKKLCGTQPTKEK